MSYVPPRRISLPIDQEAWRSARDARRKVLAKVHARRQLMSERQKTAPRTW